MFGSKRHKGTVLVADVDDASVGVALVELGERARIMRFERALLPFEKRSADHSASAVAQLLSDALDKVVKAHTADPKANAITGSYAIVRAPWIRFRTAQAEELYESPTVITESIIAELTKKALQQPSDIDVANRLESGVMHVYLNGYPTGTPSGKQATRASVTAYESSISADARRMVTDALLKALPGREPVLRSSTSALLGVAAEYMPETQRSVLIDIGSSTTQCAVILRESVTKTEMLSEGFSTILTKIGAGAFPEETLTQLRMLATDTCATDSCKALKDALARLEPELAKTFGEVFAKLTTERRLPNTVLLSTPAELSAWMAGFFARIDFSQFTATMQPFGVELMTAEHISDGIEWVGIQPDTGLGIAGAYVNILAANGK